MLQNIIENLNYFFFLSVVCGQTFTERTLYIKMHAKMSLATEIQRNDFSHRCKDFKGKEWQVFDF